MNSIRKWFYRPRRDDPSLIAQFYYSDEELNLVAGELDSFDGRKDPERCTALVNQLRQCQDKVLNICMDMMDELLPNERASRDFRVKFPDDVIQESLAGQLWFGAECLAAGSNILNREAESAGMRPIAKAITKTIENVRNLLREQCLKPVPEYTEKTCESLKILDRLFAEFELCYVSAMVPVKSIEEHDMQQNVVVLFSDTLQRAFKLGLVNQDQIDNYDPVLMFAIPRLAIISGLVIFPDGPLNLEKDSKNLSELFRPFKTLLRKIQELLWTMSPQELATLEKCLCSLEEPDINMQQLNDNRSLNEMYGSVALTTDFIHKFYSTYPSCSQITPELSSLCVSTKKADRLDRKRERYSSRSTKILLRQEKQSERFLSKLTGNNEEPRPRRKPRRGSSHYRRYYLSAQEVSSSTHQYPFRRSHFYEVVADAQRSCSSCSQSRTKISAIVCACGSSDAQDAEETSSSLLDVPHFNNEAPYLKCKLCVHESLGLAHDQERNAHESIEGRSSDSLHYCIRHSLADKECNCQNMLFTGEQEVSSSSSVLRSLEENVPSPKNEPVCPSPTSVLLPQSEHSPSHRLISKIPSVKHYTEKEEKTFDFFDPHEGSSGSTSPHHSGTDDDEEVALALQAAEVAASWKARERFVDARDLIQRLFVCVSGVADQLQTNYASDLRKILKCVFLMNQTPDEAPESCVEIVQGEETGSDDLCSAIVSEEVGVDALIVIGSTDSESAISAITGSITVPPSIFNDHSLMQYSDISPPQLSGSPLFDHEMSGSGFLRQINELNRSMENLCLEETHPSDRASPHSITAVSEPPSPRTPDLTIPHALSPEPEIHSPGVDSRPHAIVKEPPAWVPDNFAPRCMACGALFTVVRRRHHCRNCGKIFCGHCSRHSVPLPHIGIWKNVRVCNACFLYYVTSSADGSSALS